MTHDIHVHSSADIPVWRESVTPFARQIVLAVTLSPNALMQMPRHVLAPGSAVGQTTFSDMRMHHVVGDHAPDLVLCPLVSCGFDAMDLLILLREAGYLGRFLVLAPQMPDIALIRSEMLAQAPDLNADIIAMDGQSALHLL